MNADIQENENKHNYTNIQIDERNHVEGYHPVTAKENTVRSPKKSHWFKVGLSRLRKFLPN